MRLPQQYSPVIRGKSAKWQRGNVHPQHMGLIRTEDIDEILAPGDVHCTCHPNKGLQCYFEDNFHGKRKIDLGFPCGPDVKPGKP